MPLQREYKRLSRRTRLLLSQAEGRDVDFKVSPVGVKHKTLIAFANSVSGGAILVGVEEFTSDDGVQRGRIVGCDVSDSARLQIQNKALSSVPPINIQIFTENLSQRPILRVEVPSGPNKPYCSQAGEYAIRSDNRNRALQPNELLQLFMERESEQFLSRFKTAVGKLEVQVSTMDHELRHGVDQMLDDMHRLDRDTTFILNELYGRSRDMRAETELARDIEVNLERQVRALKASLEYKYKDLARRINDNAARLDAVLAHLGIPDPLRLRARQQILDMVQLIRERNADQETSPALLDDFFDVLVHLYPEIDSATLDEWVQEALARPGGSGALPDNNRGEKPE
jgi:ATP-dependent DNA helicase RecG